MLAANSADVAAQRDLAAAVAAEYGQLDIAFINASVSVWQPIEAWTEEAFDRSFAINVKGPYFLIQSLLPVFASPASVVLNTSINAYVGMTSSSVYAATKAEWAVALLADAAGMSRAAFSATFTRQVGQSALGYVRAWRLTLARAALTRADTDIASLAGSVGYTSQSAFTYAFRRAFGVSPKAFARKRIGDSPVESRLPEGLQWSASVVHPRRFENLGGLWRRHGSISQKLIRRYGKWSLRVYHRLLGPISEIRTVVGVPLPSRFANFYQFQGEDCRRGRSYPTFSMADLRLHLQQTLKKHGRLSRAILDSCARRVPSRS